MAIGVLMADLDLRTTREEMAAMIRVIDLIEIGGLGFARRVRLAHVEGLLEIILRDDAARLAEEVHTRVWTETSPMLECCQSGPDDVSVSPKGSAS